MASQLITDSGEYSLVGQGLGDYFIGLGGVFSGATVTINYVVDVNGNRTVLPYSDGTGLTGPVENVVACGFGQGISITVSNAVVGTQIIASSGLIRS